MPSSKFFYGWIIAAMGFLTMFVGTGLIVTCFSSLSPFLMDAWGINHTLNGTLVSIRTAATVLAMFLCGVYYKKLSLRLGIALGMLIGAAGYVVMALGHGFAAGCIGVALIGFCHGIAGMIPVAILVDGWFVRHKALVLSIASTASGFASMVVPVTITKMITGFSLTFALFVMVGVFVIFAVLIVVFVKDTSQAMGLARLGEDASGTAEKKKVLAHPYAANKAHIFLMMCTSFLVAGMCYVPGAIFTLNFTSAGWDVADAARIVSLYGFILLVAKLIYGPVCDRVPQTIAAPFFFACLTIGHLIMSRTPYEGFSFGMGVAAFIIYCLGAPVSTVGIALWAGDISEPGEYAKYVRWYTLIYNIGAIVLVPIAGWTADLTGNYSVTFIGCAACSLLGLLLTSAAYRGASRRYKTLNPDEKAAAA